MSTFGRSELPAEQDEALRKAVRWEWATIAYTVCTIALIAFVVGNSQSMRTAWIEDMLSLIPQISFLAALLFIRRPPTRVFPFGLHRATGIGHLVAGVALLAVGGILAVESIIGLVTVDRPTIGTVQVFGETIWLGWLMIAVMTITVIGPLIYGPAKLKLAPKLHNKILYADADMARADWHTNAASILGVIGIGIGWWWLDGAAAVFISIGIVWDGIKNTRYAVRDLLDERARTYDSEDTHPLADELLKTMRRHSWVSDAGLRLRDQGQVFHAEVFFTPDGPTPHVETLDTVVRELRAVDWKVQDIVLIPVRQIPDEAHRLDAAP